MVSFKSVFSKLVRSTPTASNSTTALSSQGQSHKLCDLAASRRGARVHISRPRKLKAKLFQHANRNIELGAGKEVNVESNAFKLGTCTRSFCHVEILASSSVRDLPQALADTARPRGRHVELSSLSDDVLDHHIKTPSRAEFVLIKGAKITSDDGIRISEHFGAENRIAAQNQNLPQSEPTLPSFTSKSFSPMLHWTDTDVDSSDRDEDTSPMNLPCDLSDFTSTALTSDWDSIFCSRILQGLRNHTTLTRPRLCTRLRMDDLLFGLGVESAPNPRDILEIIPVPSNVSISVSFVFQDK